MNLTSKRMLRFALLCAGVCALSATAATTQYIADSFEYNATDDFPAQNGLGIVYYKAQNNGFGVPMVTNWFTAEGDASTITNVDNTGFSGPHRPMEGAGLTETNLVLNLETEGQTLTRQAFAAPQTFSEANPLYVDTLIKFTPSEDDPTNNIGSDVKAAVFVNVSSNLCIWHGVGGAGVSPAVTVTTLHIDPTAWYRLTIELTDLPGEFEDLVFQVFLNDAVITSVDAVDGGSYFYSAAAQNTLSAIAFQGTGMIDELVVADAVPGNLGSTAILLTLAFDDNKVSVTFGGNPVANGGTVDSGSEIVIDATDWYEISSVTGSDPAFTGPTGALVNITTGVVASASATTVTINSQLYSGSTTISTGLGGSQPANLVAAWASAYGKGPGDLTPAMLDDYLCNVAPDTNPQLEILSIVVDQNTSIATITVGTAASNVAFDSINGTLKVSTRDDLGIGDWGVAFEGTVTVESPSTTATVEVPIAGASYFIKAVIE